MPSGYNPARFLEAVMYIAWRTRDDARFGRVKMAKTLFYADFEAYADDGVAVTGATYEHWRFGPFPPQLYTAESELVRTGSAELKHAEFEGDEWKLVGRVAPDTSHLSDYHKALLDLKIDELAEQSSAQVSDESHDHPAWLVTQDREQIPYHAAYVPTRPSQQAMDLARRRFVEQGRHREA